MQYILENRGILNTPPWRSPIVNNAEYSSGQLPLTTSSELESPIDTSESMYLEQNKDFHLHWFYFRHRLFDITMSRQFMQPLYK